MAPAARGAPEGLVEVTTGAIRQLGKGPVKYNWTGGFGAGE